MTRLEFMLWYPCWITRVKTTFGEKGFFPLRDDYITMVLPALR